MRVRLERALDDRQQGEFERHAARFDFLHDVVQVQARRAPNTRSRYCGLLAYKASC